MANNRGLGKGLGALMGTEVNIDGSDERFITVDIKKMKPNPKQARKTFKEEEIEELADSIKIHGVIQPVLLTEDGKGNYIIIAGERRYRSAKRAGLKELPAIVKQLTDKEVMEVSLIENLQRVNLNPIEEAQGIKDLMVVSNLTQEQAADRLGKSRPSVTNALRMLKLPPKVITLIREERLSKGHAKCLLGVDDSEFILFLAEKCVAERLSVRALEQLIAKGRSKTPKKKPVLSAEIREIEERLADRLATKVSLSGNDKKGTIKIDYYSAKELDGILDKILK